MKKSDRQLIFNKYNGKCAYCGCELLKGWHVDHKEPIRRRWKYVHGTAIVEGKAVELFTRLIKQGYKISFEDKQSISLIKSFSPPIYDKYYSIKLTQQI